MSQGSGYPVFEAAYLAAMGWCLYYAKSPVSRFLTAAAAIHTLLLLPIQPWNTATDPSLVIAIISIILISAKIRLPAPALISLFISTVAAYSYAIYLLHMVPFTLLVESYYFPKGSHMTWGIVPVSLGFALGFAGQWVFDRLLRLFVRNKELST